MKKQRTSRRLRAFLRRIVTVALVLAVLSVAKIGYWSFINASPAARIDTSEAAPAGVGGEYYEKANQLLAGPQGAMVETCMGSMLSTDPNSSVLKQPTGDLLSTTVDANRSALAAIAEALRYPASTPPARYDFDYLFDVQSWARIFELLEIDAQLSEARQNWPAASDKWLRVLEASNQAPAQFPVYGWDNFHDMSWRYAGCALWSIIPRLDCQRTRRTLAELIRLRAAIPPLRVALIAQKHEGEQDLRVLFRDRNWRRELADRLCNNPPGVTTEYSGCPSAILAGIFTLRSDRSYYHEYDRVCREVMEQHPNYSEIDRECQDPVLSPLWPGCIGNGAIMNVDLAMIAAALRAYHFDHGAYPADLAKLAPSYLPAVPVPPATCFTYVYTPTSYAQSTHGATACKLGRLERMEDRKHTWTETTIACVSP